MPTLRFVGRPFDGFERALQQQMDSFVTQTATDVTFVRDHRPLPEIHNERSETGAIANGDYDLFLCLSDWLPAVAEAGDILSLESFIRDQPPVDWPDGWADSMRELVSYDGATFAVPYHDGPQLLHYREDLFESVAEQRGFREAYGRPLSVPRTWTEFLEVAEYFTRPKEGLWGTVVAALPDGHNNVYDFLIQLWSRGGSVLDDSGMPAFNSQAGRAALRFYHDLIHEHGVVPPESVELESVAAGQWYADGKAAMMWNWAGFGAMAESQESAVFGRTNYGLIPRAAAPAGKHTSLTVLYGLTIPAGSNHPELAYEFLKHVSTPESDKLTTESGASGTRFSTWRDPEILRSNTFYSVVEEINTNAVNTLPQIPAYVEFNDILNEMVEKSVVNRSVSTTDALTTAEAQARTLLSE